MIHFRNITGALVIMPDNPVVSAGHFRNRSPILESLHSFVPQAHFQTMITLIAPYYAVLYPSALNASHEPMNAWESETATPRRFFSLARPLRQRNLASRDINMRSKIGELMEERY